MTTRSLYPASVAQPQARGGAPLPPPPLMVSLAAAVAADPVGLAQTTSYLDSGAAEMLVLVLVLVLVVTVVRCPD